MPQTTGASFVCHVFPAAAFTVTGGANLGDPLGAADELCAGDVYRMAAAARPLRLAVADGGTGAGRVLGPAGAHRLAVGTGAGTPGAALRAEAQLLFLAPEGHGVSLLLLAAEGTGPLALPIDPMEPGRDHTLVGIDRDPPAPRLADAVATGFARGTTLMAADGTPRPVETLRPGDLLLTRDNGPRPLRALLRRTRRAIGVHAPAVVRQGAMGNAADLVLAQDQRLFVYQRGDDRLTDRPEMLLRAGLLADGGAVSLRTGGFVEFFTPVLDRHEVLYAECIPVESLEVSAATLATLPADLALELGETAPGLDHSPHPAREADSRLAAAARARLLRDGGP